MLDKTLITYFENINDQSVIITPNFRLSATLHKLYQQYQMECGHAAWKTPRILPVNSWLQQTWLDYSSAYFGHLPLLLNASQEQFLWEKVLANAKESEILLKLSETADLAKSARDLLINWQIDINQPIFNSTSDYQALKKWLVNFNDMLAKNHWTTSSDLISHLAQAVTAKHITPEDTILLVGFTEISPAMDSLLKTYTNHGTNIQTLSLAKEKQQAQQIGLPRIEDEISTMALWAKKQWENNPQAKIACVIPTLDKMRDRVKQLFADVFAEKHTYTVDLLTCPFNISAGKSLIEYPVIHAAIQLLHLHKQKISSSLFANLLSSPFIGEAESERIQRAALENQLRLTNINQLDLTQLPAVISEYCPAIAKRIQNIRQLLVTDAKQPYAYWMNTISSVLKTAGWPGERSLSSPEYQTIEAWLNALNEISSLDYINQPVSFHDALIALQKIIAKKIFQPQTPEAPIQVLGLLEAASLPFDYTWVMGLDDLSWPPQPKPHPFIPKKLQRELKMPHATAERELFFCLTMTQQFKECANNSIFSYSEQKDNLELQASPLIRDLPVLMLSDLELNVQPTAAERIQIKSDLEYLADNTGLAITLGERIKGGINVIKQQALCPFKAFAEWRLHARELESPLPGLRAKDRGNIVHHALEIIWVELKSQTTLLTTNPATLDHLINEAIEKSLAAHADSRSQYTNYLGLEKIRLTNLIQEWLSLEKERPSFTIQAQEKRESITLGKLDLSIRIDRIDTLESGKKLIIDYKTGNSDTNKWFGDRPEEPQLPLYALMDPKQTVGIAFAQVATGNSSFKGISQSTLDIQGIKPAYNWQEQIEQWQATLSRLSDDFYHGVANVDPKESPQTCQWCALKPLCRINEEQNP